MQTKLKNFLKNLRFYAAVFITSLVFTLVVRAFVVAAIISIPSESMNPAVQAGDRIIVTKLIPGPHIYKEIRQIRIDGKIQTKRFKGMRKVRRNLEYSH